MRCGICSYIWKASRKNGMNGWNLHRERLQNNSQGCESLFKAQAPAILCCPLNNHPKHTINRKNSSQQPSMVGFFRVLSSLSVLRPSHREGMLCTLSGNLIPIARPPCKHPVDSFNFWWQVWTMSTNTPRHWFCDWFIAWHWSWSAHWLSTHYPCFSNIQQSCICEN